MIFREIYSEKDNINNLVEIREYNSLVNNDVLCGVSNIYMTSKDNMEFKEEFGIKKDDLYTRYTPILEVTIDKYNNIDFISYIIKSKNIYFVDNLDNKIKKVYNVFSLEYWNKDVYEYEYVIELSDKKYIKLKHNDKILIEREDY